MRKELRIRKNEEFASIIKKHKSISSDKFIIYVQLKKEDNARIGLSVSKKLGNAVVRNKIKRQIRMMLQECVDFFVYPYDVIVIVRKNYLNDDYSGNKKDLEKLLKTVNISEYRKESI